MDKEYIYNNLDEILIELDRDENIYDTLDSFVDLGENANKNLTDKQNE